MHIFISNSRIHFREFFYLKLFPDFTTRLALKSAIAQSNRSTRANFFYELVTELKIIYKLKNTNIVDGTLRLNTN
ncbi:MAG: hypothetical protein ACI9Z4_001334 [Polaribacter sp.]|jgi:hypothetical protein